MNERHRLKIRFARRRTQLEIESEYFSRTLRLDLPDPYPRGPDVNCPPQVFDIEISSDLDALK